MTKDCNDKQVSFLESLRSLGEGGEERSIELSDVLLDRLELVLDSGGEGLPCRYVGGAEGTPMDAEFRGAELLLLHSITSSACCIVIHKKANDENPRHFGIDRRWLQLAFVGRMSPALEKIYRGILEEASAAAVRELSSLAVDFASKPLARGEIVTWKSERHVPDRGAERLGVGHPAVVLDPTFPHRTIFGVWDAAEKRYRTFTADCRLMRSYVPEELFGFEIRDASAPRLPEDPK